jgi:hypothetical protein
MSETIDKPKKRRRPSRYIEPVIEISSDPIRVMVRSVCPNPSWVYASLDGFRIEIKCPSKLSKSLVGKEINIELVPPDVGNHYEYKP